MDFRDKKQFEKNPDAVNKHIEKYFGNAETVVFHEIPTLDLHIDIFHIKPLQSDYEILLTVGMSSIAMNVSEIPTKPENYKFAELITLIPRGLEFGKFYPSGSINDWIITMIKQAAKFPHFDNTWIGIGHTIQSDAGMEPYSNNTDFCGCIVLPSVTLPEGFQRIKTENGIINIYSLFPIYEEELQFKIQNGYSAFLQYLIDNNANEVINFNRENYCE